MTWLVWRQHRIEGLILVVVLAVIGVFLLVTGLEMANSFQQFRLSNCLGQISKGGSSCYELGMAWNSQYGGFLRGAALLLALPLLLGALVGAPLVAQEVEQRTHLLIWTQSITRLRWLTVMLALVLGAGLLASGALLAVLSWWNSPRCRFTATRLAPESTTRRGRSGWRRHCWRWRWAFSRGR